MPFLIKYDSYPDKFKEVRMELGSHGQYQEIKALEVVPPLKEGEIEQDAPREYEMLFKVVDNRSNSIVSHTMTREELNEYIDILKRLLAQTK